MTDETPPPRTKISAKAWLPGLSLTYERELIQQAQELRDEFTPEKRDELLAQIWEGAGGSDTLRAQAEFQYFLTMLQVNSSEQATRGLTRATILLAVFTLGLVVAGVVALFR
jgi:hypothetical protein